jgi:FkbM family methyltransferase
VPTRANSLYREVIGRLPNGDSFSFAVHSVADQHVSAMIAETGRWEPFATRILWGLLGPGDGVLDIGANIGWYGAVLGRAVGRSGFVHSFEPDPANAKLLTLNVADLRQVSVHPIALADMNGVMELALSEDNLGDHRLMTSKANDRKTQLVSTERLDDFVARTEIEVKRLRIIKIDTQGAEVMILRGATNLMLALPTRCALLIEFAPNLLASHGHESVSEFIETLTAFDRPMYAVRRASIHRIDAEWLRSLANKLRSLGDEWAVDVLVAPDGDGQNLWKYRIPRPVRLV